MMAPQGNQCVHCCCTSLLLHFPSLSVFNLQSDDQFCFHCTSEQAGKVGQEQVVKLTTSKGAQLSWWQHSLSKSGKVKLQIAGGEGKEEYQFPTNGAMLVGAGSSNAHKGSLCLQNLTANQVGKGFLSSNLVEFSFGIKIQFFFGKKEMLEVDFRTKRNVQCRFEEKGNIWSGFQENEMF